MAVVDTNSKIRLGVISVITLMWVVNITASIISERYEPNEAINALMMAVVGALLVAGRKNGSKEDN